MNDYKTRMDTYRQEVETYLSGCFTDMSLPQKTILDAMRYSLLAGGKRIRPVLLLEFCRLCGKDYHEALPFAAAIEMVHTYSLIHDDLPCMDNDDYRRGRLTNHKVFGEAMAVLAGDALLNRAFETMLSQRTVAAEPAMRAAACIARCSGLYGMIGGQIQDLALEGKSASDEELREMVSLKTGALIRAACVGGVLLAGGTAAQQQAAEAYADALGLAFQIRDDILDVTGDRAVLGKATGSDAANDKTTFVSVYGLEACRGLVRRLTLQAMTAAEAFSDREFLQKLAEYLARREK